MRHLAIFMFIFYSIYAQAQKEGNVWCFPKNCKIDWSDSLNPVVDSCNLGNFGTLTSSSFFNENSSKLFYGGGINFLENGGELYDETNTLIQNGDSIYAYPYCCNGFLILNDPGHIHQSYVFSITYNVDSVAYTYIYYSKILDTLSIPYVSIKNYALTSIEVNQKIASVRHANGRDWWLVLQSTLINQYMFYLISTDGITLSHVQTIGSPTTTIFPQFNMYQGQMDFSQDGNLLITSGYYANLDVFDFDRCTGYLSNPKIVGENNFNLGIDYLGCSISPNNKYLYASTNYNNVKKIFQYCLDSSNVQATKTLIHEYPDTGIAFTVQYGLHKLGPDGKIYIAKGNPFGAAANTTFTNGLDAILNPDTVYPFCNYTTNYLSLGNNYGRMGLPNIPNYKLGPVIGSVCDSLGLGEKEILKERYLNVYPNPSTGIFNFELKQKTDAIKEIAVYNSMGKKIFIGTSPQIDLSKVKAGLYYYRSITLNGRIYKGKLQKF